MEKKTVDVIIPAYRPGEGWKQMLRGLEGQTWKGKLESSL